jgi:PKD repeat protein
MNYICSGNTKVQVNASVYGNVSYDPDYCSIKFTEPGSYKFDIVTKINPIQGGNVLTRANAWPFGLTVCGTTLYSVEDSYETDRSTHTIDRITGVNINEVPPQYITSTWYDRFTITANTQQLATSGNVRQYNISPYAYNYYEQSSEYTANVAVLVTRFADAYTPRPPPPPLPIPDFVANVYSGDEPLTVQFTDTSLNNPTSWYWDFGDGNATFDQNPVHTYTTADGSPYTVTMTCSNEIGEGTPPAQATITVNAVQTPGVVTSTATGEPGAIITLEFYTVGVPDYTVLTWNKIAPSGPETQLGGYYIDPPLYSPQNITIMSNFATTTLTLQPWSRSYVNGVRGFAIQLFDSVNSQYYNSANVMIETWTYTVTRWIDGAIDSRYQTYGATKTPIVNDVWAIANALRQPSMTQVTNADWDGASGLYVLYSRPTGPYTGIDVQEGYVT